MDNWPFYLKLLNIEKDRYFEVLKRKVKLGANLCCVWTPYIKTIWLALFKWGEKTYMHFLILFNIFKIWLIKAFTDFLTVEDCQEWQENSKQFQTVKTGEYCSTPLQNVCSCIFSQSIIKGCVMTMACLSGKGHGKKFWWQLEFPNMNS